MDIKTEPDELGHNGGDKDIVNVVATLEAANKALLQGIFHISKRLEVIEEFADVQMGASREDLNRFAVNKKRIAYALGISDPDLFNNDRSNHAYIEMMKLVRSAFQYWDYFKRSINRPSNRDARLMFENSIPEEFHQYRLFVNFDTGFIVRKPKKFCQKCYDESHVAKDCPHKLVAERTPEVTQMIQERLEKVRMEILEDPLLSTTFKNRWISKGQPKQSKDELIELAKANNLDDNVTRQPWRWRESGNQYNKRKERQEEGEEGRVSKRIKSDFLGFY